MKNKIKTPSKVSLAVFGSYLVLSGLGYTPKPKPVPSKKFIKETYVRYTGEHRWYASEKRRRHIMAEIRKLREAIRLQAQAYYAFNKRQVINLPETESYDEYLAVRNATLERETDKHSHKLIINYLSIKVNKSNESDLRKKRQAATNPDTIG